MVDIADSWPVLTRDRREEAWQIVKRLHGSEGEDEQGLQYARQEFYQMTEQVQVDAAAWNEGGWRGMFTKRSYQKRFWMGFFIQYAAQSTGAQVIYGKSACGSLPISTRCSSYGCQCTSLPCTRIWDLRAEFR